MSAEIGPMSDGKMEFRVQRHDNHVEGHLTPKGQEHAREVADETVKSYLDKNPDTHFLVINSDQPHYTGVHEQEDTPPYRHKPEEDFGNRRAQETGQIIVGAIKNELAARGLPEEQLFGYDEVDPTTVAPTMREADIFENGFMKHLREVATEKNEEWKLYYQDVDRDLREELGAEPADDLALRMDYTIKSAEMAAASFHRTPGNEDKPLVVWMVGHGGGLDAFLYNYAGVPLEEVGFDVSGGFTLRANEDGQVVAEVKGKDYVVVTPDTLDLPEDAVGLPKSGGFNLVNETNVETPEKDASKE